MATDIPIHPDDHTDLDLLDTESDLLAQIDSPADLRKLDPEDLPRVADELREFLIESVSKTGGHLSAGLGTVELTVALHYVFKTPEDRLVWDVGHQTYPHKILTGRREAMSTVRQKDGLCGFTRREESEYDTFGVGHSSTSISAALGMAVAAAAKEEDHDVVAVIGDGAMSAGMAFEALNCGGEIDANLLVILNDNEMSISPNVGGLSNHLARILSGRVYSSAREGSKNILSRLGPLWNFAKRSEEHMKGMFMPGTLFEELGFNYIGPIDGHDMTTLVKTLCNMKNLKGPRFLHVITKKGKGYLPAENDPCTYHGVSSFDIESGESLKKSSTAPDYSAVFGSWLCDMAEKDSRLIGITPAMGQGSGMVNFSQQFPDRYFDVGIAEQHAVTFAAGLAVDGLKPVVAIYSTFLQRAYDQLIHDVAIQNLPVVFAIDRAGLVGADGPTHAGAFDLSYLRCIPNMTIMTPADEDECRKMLTTAFQLDTPAAVRYPRGCGPGVSIEKTLLPIEIGKSRTLLHGKQVALLAFGSMVSPAVEVGKAINATVIDMRFVKPLDEEIINSLSASHELLVTLEENAIKGGAGSAVNEYLSDIQSTCQTLNLGLPDHFIEHGDTSILLAECGLDAAGIQKTILNALPVPLAQSAESA
ncbi:MAG: 1-deoxy-D-xylulose-5-phosphate synthase [Gammaproteobacteria bacterium]|nr:1-deoxy-D-xylulose-5-phosphate synthase [Gammaproteobacteria bacterium]MDX2488475.1 1-deoxy-D-xylulose-5-phosphate synthase [Gammaproteobacteria bacterium]